MHSPSLSIPTRKTHKATMLIMGLFLLIFTLIFTTLMCTVFLNNLFQQEQAGFVAGSVQVIILTAMLLFDGIFLFIGAFLTLWYCYGRRQYYFGDNRVVYFNQLFRAEWGGHEIEIREGDMLICELMAGTDARIKKSMWTSKKEAVQHKFYISLLREGTGRMVLYSTIKKGQADSFVQEFLAHYPLITLTQKAPDTIESTPATDKHLRMPRKWGIVQTVSLGIMLGAAVNMGIKAYDYQYPKDTSSWQAVPSKLLRTEERSSGSGRSHSSTIYGYFSYSYGNKAYKSEDIILSNVKHHKDSPSAYTLYVQAHDPSIHAIRPYGEHSLLRTSMIYGLIMVASAYVFIASLMLRPRISTDSSLPPAA